MSNGFGQIRRELKKSLERDSGCLEAVKAEKRREIQQISDMQTHCMSVIWDATNFLYCDWKDPIYLGHLRMGHNKKHATKWLSERIKSALHNLSLQQKRGAELFEQREAEHAAGQDGQKTPSEMEWSDAEGDFNIEDDVPLADDNKVYRPSRKWVAKHARMESVTSDWNLERLANEESRQRAKEQGSSNSMDGRYH